MRTLILLFLALSATACSQSTAGLTIPARQQFVLGEYMRTDFTATMRNRGEVPVTVTTVDKRTGAERQRVDLPVGKRVSVAVAADAEARLYNANDQRAEIKVMMNKGVNGMSYRELDGSPLRERTEDVAAGEAAGAVPVDPELLGTPVSEVDTKIPARSQLIVGEGTSDNYSVDLRNFGGRDVEVSVLDKQSGRQTQGFGLGVYGKVTVNIRPNENLHVENYGGNGCRVKMELSEPVVGVRTVELVR